MPTRHDSEPCGCRDMDEAASTDDAFADYVENVDANDSDSECEDEVRLVPCHLASVGLTYVLRLWWCGLALRVISASLSGLGRHAGIRDGLQRNAGLCGGADRRGPSC